MNSNSRYFSGNLQYRLDEDNMEGAPLMNPSAGRACSSLPQQHQASLPQQGFNLSNLHWFYIILAVVAALIILKYLFKG